MNLFPKYTPAELCLFKYHRILKAKDIHRLCVAMYMYKMLNIGVMYMYKMLNIGVHASLLQTLDLQTPNQTPSIRSPD